MKVLLSLFAVFLPIVLNAQVLDDKIQKQMEILKQSNIDTFLVYSFSCYGGIVLDSCESEETQYLFWMQNSQAFLKRFDYCKDYSPIQIDSLNPLSFYIKNKVKIDKEEIRPPAYYEVKRTEKGLDTSIYTIGVDHTCFHQFHFIAKRNTKKISIDKFDLNAGKKNINYSYNQKTRQKELVDIVSKLIEELKHDQKFQAQ